MTHRLEARLLLVGEDEPTVWRCVLREAMSTPFEASVEISAHGELDLDRLLGRRATLRLADPDARQPGWELTSICALAEHIGVAHDGSQLYSLQLVPPLWTLSRRETHRVFCRRSIPEIVSTLFDEWGVEALWDVDRTAHPALACRIQYGESDLAFAHRLLAEAGISYFFESTDGGTRLCLTDAPHALEPRLPGPLPYLARPTHQPGNTHVTDVILRRAPDPARLTLQGFDFRRPAHRLIASASTGVDAAETAERFAYEPASFWVDGDASSPGGRALERHGEQAAKRALAAAVAGTRTITFRTTALSLAPGARFSIDGHPCAELSPDRKHLLLERTIEGGATIPWAVTGRAAVSPARYHPPRAHRRPSIHGVQSAVVVGPRGEEIHTDELGRVCIRFHWQREDPGQDLGLWVRVSHGWAGAGYGMIALPRVGEEVLVEFLDGDVDHPVVVGRVYNGTHPTPHALPANRSKTAWRSASTPGGEGHNELSFEDARGRELVHLRAERDLDTLVRRDASEAVGNNRVRRVGVDEAVAVGAAQSIAVGGSRTATIGTTDVAEVGLRHAVTIAPAAGHPETVGPTRSEMVDRKITLTTGEASITLEGPNITLEAAAGILLRAVSDITIAGNANIRVIGNATVRVESERGDVVVQGAPFVRINPEPRGTDEAGLPPVEVPPGVDLDENVSDAESEAWFEPEKPEGIAERARKGGAWHPLRWGPTFAEFGYFHLGLMARASGLPRGVLVRQAGKLHQAEHGADPERGHPGNGLWGGKAPYGNDARFLELLQKGCGFYEKNYR